MSSSESIRDKLELLKRKFADQLPDKVNQVEDSINGLLGKGHDEEKLKEAIRLAHTLSGSSSSFGFAVLGSSAKKLENLLKDALRDGSGISQELKRSVDEYILEIRKNIPAFAELPGVSILSKPSSEAQPVTSLEKSTQGITSIYLVEDDPVLRNTLSLQLRHFGYDVKVLRGPSDLMKAVQEAAPDIIITDILWSEGDFAGIEAIEDLKKDNPEISVIFMSKSSDLDTRIRAARAGGDAYLLKPLNISGLIDKIDELISDMEVQDPYRILIIDDDPELASYYSLILGQAQMRTTIVNNPFDVMPPLVDFNPDLILMDMYMPGCNGLELAKVIRQIESYVSIPIVFLSAETNIEKQLNAMSMGGDDFLTKPIKADHLISSVSMRAGRMRIIRSFMDRDSLTGLLNHTKTKEQLDVILERARRNNTPLSFAMIDIDKFKSVNDTYGHPTGDRVIMSLSKLLQQRLRRTDVIGRYGGEEFAAVLVDTGKESAKVIFDEIRESFSQIRHQAEKNDFTSTFSCGIASFPEFDNAKAIGVAADKALYKAKGDGRNRVVVAL